MNFPEMQYLRNRVTGQVKCAGHINFVGDETYEVVLGFPPPGLFEGEVPPPPPILSGKVLVEFVRGLFKGLPFQQRVALLTPIQPHFDIMKEELVVSLSDYEEFKVLLIDALVNTVSEGTVTFAVQAVTDFLTNFKPLE